MYNERKPKWVCRNPLILIILLLPQVWAYAAETPLWNMPLEALKKRAEAGEANAQLSLAHHFRYGKNSVAKDSQAAAFWYEKASDQGDTQAKARLGAMYASGEGVLKDFAKAESLLYEATKDGTRNQSREAKQLIELSKSGHTKCLYAGTTVEAHIIVYVLDPKVPLPQLLSNLAADPDPVMTGKAYLIGYNQSMHAIAAKGVEAIEPLKAMAMHHPDPSVQDAAITTLHLIGINSGPVGNLEESFTSKPARVALRELLAVEGLTNHVATLLKRDPWPGDVPAIMDALEVVKDNFSLAINSLSHYPLEDLPLDPDQLNPEFANRSVPYTYPASYNEVELVQSLAHALKEDLPNKVIVADDAFSALSSSWRRGPPNRDNPFTPLVLEAANPPTPEEGFRVPISELLNILKDRSNNPRLRQMERFAFRGRSVYFQFAPLTSDSDLDISGNSHNDKGVQLHILGPESARKALLKWWHTSGQMRYLP